MTAPDGETEDRDWSEDDRGPARMPRRPPYAARDDTDDPLDHVPWWQQARAVNAECNAAWAACAGDGEARCQRSRIAAPLAPLPIPWNALPPREPAAMTVLTRDQSPDQSSCL